MPADKRNHSHPPPRLENLVSLDHYKTTRQGLKARLDAIDLAGARRRLAEAREALASAPDFTHAGAHFVGETPEMRAGREEWTRLSRAVKDAQADLLNREAEERNLRRELQHVESLLGAEAEARGAERLASSMAASLEAAEAVAKASAQTEARLADLIATEERAIESRRAAAAQQLLEAVKAGSEQPAVTATSTDQLATLREAHQAAGAEKTKADAAVARARADLVDAQRALDVARSNVVELSFRHAERAYIEALTEVYAAKSRARVQGFSVVDPRTPAIERAMAAVNESAMAEAKKAA
jgi:hypothetical protein